MVHLYGARWDGKDCSLLDCMIDSDSRLSVKDVSRPLYPAIMFIHRNVTAVEHQVRPKGLGLGANRSLIKDLEPSKRKQPPKPGDERVREEELVMGPGSCVLVESGPHKDKYGKVELI